MGIPIVQADAFTAVKFRGNSAAVCLLDGPRDAEWMQNVALEMNLAETAFIFREAAEFRLRWFTPAIEVDLCGHATLAAAHVLWQEGWLKPDEQARFQSRSGLLTADRDGDWIELDFPATPAEPVVEPEGLSAILDAPATYVGRNRFDLLVEIASEATLRSLAPDLRALRAFPARGVIVTCRAESTPYDFLSRFFAPAAGIDEDPVTGSAHCTLGPYWAAKLGKTELLAYQASPRGGVVRVKCVGDRIKLGGQAVTVLRGELV